MSKADQAPEPSMDEILASIRRIISDEPTSGSTGQQGSGENQVANDIANALSPQNSPAPQPQQPPSGIDDDILDLTQVAPIGDGAPASEADMLAPQSSANTQPQSMQPLQQNASSEQSEQFHQVASGIQNMPVQNGATQSHPAQPQAVDNVALQEHSNQALTENIQSPAGFGHPNHTTSHYPADQKLEAFHTSQDQHPNAQPPHSQQPSNEMYQAGTGQHVPQQHPSGAKHMPANTQYSLGQPPQPEGQPNQHTQAPSQPTHMQPQQHVNSDVTKQNDAMQQAQPSTAHYQGLSSDINEQNVQMTPVQNSSVSPTQVNSTQTIPVQGGTHEAPHVSTEISVGLNETPDNTIDEHVKPTQAEHSGVEHASNMDQDLNIASQALETALANETGPSLQADGVKSHEPHQHAVSQQGAENSSIDGPQEVVSQEHERTGHLSNPPLSNSPSSDPIKASEKVSTDDVTPQAMANALREMGNEAAEDVASDRSNSLDIDHDIQQEISEALAREGVNISSPSTTSKESVSETDQPKVGLALGAAQNLSDETNAQFSGQSSNSETPFEQGIKQMLKPMLKEWLDQNMPRLVEDAMKDKKNNKDA